jgi:ParB/RepB/Spo0J family partition protein
MSERGHLAESLGLMQLNPAEIERNPENPRLIFHEDTLEILRDSIRKVGILVPLLVYQRTKDRKYVLLDGERRWLCALDLKLKEVPANVIAEPNKLSNILTMFNIHNVRESWEPMPTALKLEVLMRLLKIKDNETLAAHTGLSVGYVARCKKLLNYDKKYQDMMLLAARDERVKADFFVELYPIFGQLKKYLPEIDEKYNKKQITDAFLSKYQKNVITDVIDFRQLSRMIRAIDKGASRRDIKVLVERLLEDPDFSIRTAYEASARVLYDIARLEETCRSLKDSLNSLDVKVLASRPPSIEMLKDLKDTIERILEMIR